MVLPFISVVVPVLNEAKYIVETLMALNNQDYPVDRFEILVVDGGSTDDTRCLVDEFSVNARVVVACLDNPRKLSSAARNIGVRASKGDYVLFVDGHVDIPTAALIMSMAKAAVDIGALVLARSQPLTGRDNDRFQNAVAATRSSRFGHSRESLIYSDYQGWVSPLSVAIMYHRSVFEKHGMFDENFDAAEDLEFNYRLEKAGVKAYMSPDFRINYYPRKNLKALFRQMQRYGTGRIRVFRKHDTFFRIEMFFPCFVSLGVLLFPIFILLSGGFWPLLFLAAVVALGMLCADVWKTAKNDRFYSCVVSPIVLCVVYFGLGWGVAKEFFLRPSAGFANA